MAELTTNGNRDTWGPAGPVAHAASSVAVSDLFEVVAGCMEHAARIGDRYLMDWMLTNPDWATEVRDDLADDGSVTGRRMVAAKARMAEGVV